MADRLSLHSLAVVVLAAAGFAAAPARAGSLSFSFSYSGLDVVATGTLTTTDVLAGGAYTVMGISGTRNGDPITGLLAPNSFDGNDNLLFPDPPYVSDFGIGYKVGTNSYRLFLGATVSEACATIFERVAASAAPPCAEDPIPDLNLVVQSAAAVPEPATATLLGAGLLGLLGAARRLPRA